MLQKKWLITHDPKALHHIFIKEQDHYPEPILYVLAVYNS